MAKNKNKLSKREVNYIKKLTAEGKEFPETLKKRIAEIKRLTEEA